MTTINEYFIKELEKLEHDLEIIRSGDIDLEGYTKGKNLALSLIYSIKSYAKNLSEKDFIDIYLNRADKTFGFPQHKILPPFEEHREFKG